MQEPCDQGGTGPAASSDIPPEALVVGFGVPGESRGRKRPHPAPRGGGAGSQLFPHPPSAGDSVASSYMALQGSVLEKQVGRQKQEPRKVLELRG